MKETTTLPRIFAFLAALLLLSVAAHVALETGFRRIRNGQFGAFNEVAEGRASAGIVIVGSSRAALHYDPRILEQATGLDAFNLGRVGARVEVDAGVLGQYLGRNRRPRVLIQNVDFNTFALSRGLYDPPQYTPYIGPFSGDDALYAALRTRHGKAWAMRYIPLYGYVVDDTEFRRGLAFGSLAGDKLPSDGIARGYLPSRREWSDRRVRSMDQPRYVYTAHPEAVASFEATLKLALSRGIPIVAVLSPYHELALNKTHDREGVIANLKRIAERQGATFWDYSNMAGVSARSEYFGDQFHLNWRGAEVFSAAVGKQLAAWLANQPAPEP